MTRFAASRPPSALSSVERTLRRNQGALFAAAALIVLLVIYQAQAGRILTPIQVRILLNGSLSLVWAALGMTFVVVVGGLDLSVGSVISLANVLAATLLAGSLSDPVVLVAILVIGGLTGLLNGLLVAVARIQSIIVTLAAMFIWSGVALLIMPQPGGVIPGYLGDLFGGSITPQLPASLVWIVAIAVVIGIFRWSPAWNAVFAVGGDEANARRSGIRAMRVKLAAYTAAGICYALAGLFLSAQSTGGDANIGTPFLLTAFAAVVVGGTPLGGGRGTFLGSILGALIMSTLGSVLLALGVTSYMTDVVEGSVLIVAVVAPALVGRVTASRTIR